MSDPRFTRYGQRTDWHKPRSIGPDPIQALNGCYTQLKALGWQSTMTVHKIDRVPLLALDGATIRRNKAALDGWIVELPGKGEFEMEGDLGGITRWVRMELGLEIPFDGSPVHQPESDDNGLLPVA